MTPVTCNMHDVCHGCMRSSIIIFSNNYRMSESPPDRVPTEGPNMLQGTARLQATRTCHVVAVTVCYCYAWALPSVVLSLPSLSLSSSVVLCTHHHVISHAQQLNQLLFAFCHNQTTNSSFIHYFCFLSLTLSHRFCYLSHATCYLLCCPVFGKHCE